MSWRVAGLSTLMFSSFAFVAVATFPKQHGCPSYTPVAGKTLIAHAGGGLPDATYANNIRAMDLAAQHGFRLIEIDFWQIGDRIILSHSKPTGGELELADLVGWLDQHPGIIVVTDFKTDNVRGLTALANRANPSRFVPQIYNPSEFSAVVSLGMRKPILTLYRVAEPWREFANSADLWAVTIPEDKRNWAEGVGKPILLHTINSPKPYNVAGFYTDCLIPGDR